MGDCTHLKNSITNYGEDAIGVVALQKHVRRGGVPAKRVVVVAHVSQVSDEAQKTELGPRGVRVAPICRVTWTSPPLSIDIVGSQT